MARKQCRIWWPEQLLYREPDADLLLFGWCMNSANSVDFVVAHATSAAKISAAVGELELQDILHSINSKMPMPLQEASTFCMLGHCAMCCRNGDTDTVQNQQIDSALKGMQFHGLEENAVTGTIRCNDLNGDYKENIPVIASHVKNQGGWSCGYKIQNQYMEDFLSRHGNWIQLLSKSQGILYKDSKWIPEFHHMHQSGHILTNCDVHLVIYEPPTYGRHHVSVNSWGYCERIVTPFKKPNWFSELYKKPEKPNLEAVVWALNCASAAMISFNGFFSTIDPVTNCSIISRLLCMLWYVLAVFVASMSTVLYVFLQLFHIFVRLGSHSLCSVMLQKLFTQTWNNFNVRSRQFLYWPIFLVGTGFRRQPNLEYAHMTELRKHSIWSSIAVDVIMGIFFGMVTLANARSVYNGTLFVARNINDNLLRSGCVWLMGIPAGFKLNTELAEVLGMVSLNAIQIFSTLWFFLGSFFGQLIKGLALSGIFFGLTIPAALCIDMLKAATIHIQALHWLMSFLYSRQIQALASLWRLFRGRKWNPLRQRLDSYDYNVEQHVVGSLLFTPLLLLLPTTSVFYIFFTILNATICCICILIEIAISILHATPYADILLWVTRRKRFPSGIWFEIISGCHGLDQSKTADPVNERVLQTVVSLLRSNYATLAQIVAPNYKNLFQWLTLSIDGPSAYGILSGQRTPSALKINLKPALPWMQISCMEYWRLCHSSVLACGPS